jgi:hypothetical protein
VPCPIPPLSHTPQTEGAIDADGRSVSVWDHYVKNNPDKIRDGSNAAVANDFYHRYKVPGEQGLPGARCGAPPLQGRSPSRGRRRRGPPRPLPSSSSHPRHANPIPKPHPPQEDFALMKSLGIKNYRFSISWGRLIPSGRKGGAINQKGVDFYNAVIDEVCV